MSTPLVVKYDQTPSSVANHDQLQCVLPVSINGQFPSMVVSVVQIHHSQRNHNCPVDNCDVPRQHTCINQSMTSGQ